MLRVDSPASLVDNDRYPVDKGGGPLDAVVDEAGRAFEADGVAILPGFLNAAAVARMCSEAGGLSPSAFYERYDFESTYPGPADVPARDGCTSFNYRATGSLGVVAYDQFPTASLARSLFEWDPLTDFVRRILDRERLYRYACPLGALNLSSMVEGDVLGWHFDQAEFVVSLALQSSERGGEFESARNIRSGDDLSVDAVRHLLLDHDRSYVETYPMTPGTLMLFQGKHSMHRVTRIEGPTPRYVLLLGYALAPDVRSSERLSLLRYGRLS